MKNNFFLLTKINLLASLDMRNTKANKAKNTSLMVYIGLVFGVLVLAGFALSYIYGKTLIESGSYYVYSTIYVSAILTMMMLSTTITTVKSNFVGKDYEMLKSMPIRRSTVVASKLVGLYLLELAYSMSFLIPNAIIGIVLTKDVMNFVAPFVMTFLLPGLPIVVGALISLLISMFSDRFKFANIISFILYIGVFAAIFAVSFLSGRNQASGTFEDTAKVFMWFNPSLYFLHLAFRENMIHFLTFVGINVGSLVVIFTFLALIYDYVHGIITLNRSNNKYERKELKNKGEFKTLFNLELKKITSSKLAFINSIMPGFSAVMIAGIAAFTIKSNANFNDASEVIRNFGYVGSLFIMFGAGISTPSSFTISLEGKNFWMLKAYPIDIKKLIKAKLLVSIIFTLPSALIATTLIVIFIQPSIYSIIMLYVIVIAYLLLVNILAIRINLAFPKLKWTNENEVLKNSASIVATMFIDWGIVLASSGLMIGLMFVNMYLSPIITLIPIVIMAIAFYIAIMKRCSKIIESYENF